MVDWMLRFEDVAIHAPMISTKEHAIAIPTRTRDFMIA